MKKIYALLSAVVLAAASIAATVSANSSDSLFNANVEALADTEAGGFGPMCSKTGLSGDYYVKKCTDCNGPAAKYDISVSAFCPN